MNLFYLDEDLDKAAQYHVDKHIVKMPLEAAQILCTTIWIDELLGFVPRALNAEEREVMNKATFFILFAPEVLYYSKDAHSEITVKSCRIINCIIIKKE
jgi:hypothetical protein